MIDETYTITDLNGTKVEFGDVLIGRINYQICYGVLSKIKTNPKTYYAHCIDKYGNEIAFDIYLVDKSKKTARIDAYSYTSLVELQKTVLASVVIKPLFIGPKEVKEEKRKPVEEGIKKLAKYIYDIVIKDPNPIYYASRDISFKFNKIQYNFTIRYSNNKWDLYICEDIEIISTKKHPMIINALNGIPPS